MGKPKKFPKQKQTQPGDEFKMKPAPEIIRKDYKGSGKLKGKTALISGGDSGIGRSVAVHFAREGATMLLLFTSMKIRMRWKPVKWWRKKERYVLFYKGISKKKPFVKK